MLARTAGTYSLTRKALRCKITATVIHLRNEQAYHCLTSVIAKNSLASYDRNIYNYTVNITLK